MKAHLKTLLLLLATTLAASAADKKILLIAGKVSHGPGDHEFRAGCLLLKQCLDSVPGIQAEVHTDGWPKSEAAFDGADAILIYADGGPNHPAIQEERLKRIDALVKQGVGIGCAHYGVEVPKGDPGAALQRWIGGHYEHLYSVNPMWKPEFKSFPDHPITRGVKPFAVVDEWYFNMRWAEEKAGLTPILVAKPSDEVRKGPYVYPRGPYDHIVAASGREETMMWALERPDGGRGFGFTGGHKHVNWANENFRKVMLNALLWIAKAEVPAQGVQSSLVPSVIGQNLDPKKGSDPANITGKWAFTVESDAGTGTPTFTIWHAGQNIIGTYAGLFGTAELSGEVKGKELRFSFPVTYEGQQGTITYAGTVESSDKMSGTVQFGELGEARWTGQRSQ